MGWIHVIGVGADVLRNKIKGLKGALKSWNYNVFRHIDMAIEGIKHNLQSFDQIVESRCLSHAEKSEEKELWLELQKRLI